MHADSLLLVIPLLLGFCSAQETNFPVGPQYLITSPSTAFLRPIVPPELSFETQLPPIPSLPQIGPPVSEQAYISNSVSENGPDLFPIYYGYPMPEVIELADNAATELPSSLNETGYLDVSNEQSLMALGYGVPPGQAAAFWKLHRLPNVRVYTNEDIERLKSQ